MEDWFCSLSIILFLIGTTSTSWKRKYILKWKTGFAHLVLFYFSSDRVGLAEGENIILEGNGFAHPVLFYFSSERVGLAEGENIILEGNGFAHPILFYF